MKYINILLIFILNIKLIFCQDYFLLQNYNSPDLVLDVKESSQEESAPVILWSKTGNDNQLWSYDNGFLINKSSGKVLTVKSNQSDGSIQAGSELVQAERKSGSESFNQLWDTSLGNFIRLGNNKNLAVSAQNGKYEAGSIAVVDTLSDSEYSRDNQRWIRKRV